jgi:hypothetical protein
MNHRAGVDMKRCACRFAVISSFAMLVAASCGNSASRDGQGTLKGPAAGTFPACPASPSWVSAPNPPTEVGGPGVPVGDETFCQFYQFAEQWFLSLVSPSSTPGTRVFEEFNVVGASGMTSCSSATAALTGPRLSGKDALKKALFARVTKPQTGDFDPVLPANLEQAGTGDALFDQNGNVVLYAIMYNSTECQATPAGFAPNTIEIKTSWRILTKPDPTYYTMPATVQFKTGPQDLLLGMVGFHMAINTALHPEFIWVTYEHEANDPDCNQPQPAPAAGWSFTSAAAAQCLASGGINACGSFQFNQGSGATAPTGGTPTQTCRTYPDGTDPVPPLVGPNGNSNGLNQFTIDTLNDQLVGPNGILTMLPPSNPMAVFANYSMQGGLWTNGGTASGPVDNQRGSLELANTTMETFVQNPPPTANTNCFGCHNYTPSDPLSVSHIYEAAPAKAAALKRRAAARAK